MSALPPPGYVPLSVGVLLLVAYDFRHKLSTIGEFSRDFARFTAGNSHLDRSLNPPKKKEFELKIEDINLIGPKFGHEDYGKATGVRLVFKNKIESPFFIANTGIKAFPVQCFTLDLIPPYVNCFETAQIKARLNKDRTREGMERPAPAGYDVFLPSSLPPAAGLAFKQALADGRASALLIETDGTASIVPEKFWRTEAGNTAVLGNDVALVNIDERLASGRIYIHASEIEADWQIIVGSQPRKIPKHLFSPYIRLAMQVSINLNLQDGRDQNNARELVKRIAPEIDRLWDEFMNFDLKDVAGAKARVATIVRHPQDITGGRYTGKAVPEKKDGTPKRRRQARLPRGRN